MVDIITYIIVIVLIAIFALLVAYPLHFLWKYVKCVILSAFSLVITNFLGLPFGFSLGINIITILICALLGIPGLTMLILIKLFL